MNNQVRKVSREKAQKAQKRTSADSVLLCFFVAKLPNLQMLKLAGCLGVERRFSGEAGVWSKTDTTCQLEPQPCLKLKHPARIYVGYTAGRSVERWQRCGAGSEHPVSTNCVGMIEDIKAFAAQA